MLLYTRDGKVIVGYDTRGEIRTRVYDQDGKKINVLILQEGMPNTYTTYALDHVLEREIIKSSYNIVELLRGFYLRYAPHMEVYEIDIYGFMDHGFII